MNVYLNEKDAPLSRWDLTKNVFGIFHEFHHNSQNIPHFQETFHEVLMRRHFFPWYFNV